jgi:hypothetical protein
MTGVSAAGIRPRACPEYARKGSAGHNDPDTGRLDLHPAPPTYATQLRLLEGALINVSTPSSVRTPCARYA